MRLQISNDLTGFQSMPEQIELDFLMPNACLITLKCSRDQTLSDVRDKLWYEAKLLSKRVPSIMKLKPAEHYTFASVSQDAKDVEFFDYSKRLCELNLGFMFFKLVEIEGNMDEKAYNADLAKATGLYVNELDRESNLVSNSEMSDLRAELFNLLRSHLTKSNEKEQELDVLMEILNISYNPNLELDVSLLDSTGFITRDVRGMSLTGPAEINRLTINVHVLEVGQSEYLTYNLKNIPFELTPTDLVSIIIRNKLEHPGSMSKQEVNEAVERFKHLYVLNVCGCDEIIYGSKHTIGSYKYIQRCIHKEVQPNFQLTSIESLKTKIDGDRSFLLNLVQKFLKQKEIELQSMTPQLPLNELVSWNSRDTFRIYLDNAVYLPAVKDCDKIFFKIAVYHGQELRYQTESDKLDLEGLGRDSSLKLNQSINMETVKIANLHRYSKLCISLFCMSKKKREFFSIGWISLNLFDFKGRLLHGKVKLHMWQTTQSTFLAQCLSDVTGQNPNKDFFRVNVEFMKCDEFMLKNNPNASRPVLYPNNEQIKYCISRLSNYSQDECIDISYAMENDNALLESILNKDSLAELTEQEKNVLWRRREDCVNYPHSLPKLLQSVKWFHQSDLIQMYSLLFRWPDIKPVIAIELLNNMYADGYVRQFAVKCLERHMKDEEVQQYILQLVQCLKNEPYYDNSLARFLLNRAFRSQRIGFDFYWNLKSEMKNPRYKYRFGLLLESYCRGISRCMLRDLLKQVEVVDKLSSLAQEIKSNADNISLVQTSFLKDTLDKPDYKQSLSNFISPLNRSNILGTINSSKCRILTSAKRPLYLTWNNTMSYAKFYQDTYQLIFKHGDDLRQDMLTIQILKLMDIIWKSDGLDFKMLIYDCFSTGSKTGFIEVITNSLTVFKIQMDGGRRTRYQIDSNQLYRWIGSNNSESEEALDRAVDLFTKSCAGFSVATFILGIGDRHPDNIMVSRSGNLFNIDFGHFLGHFKKKYGIKRERVPFVLTEDFAKVITKGAADPDKTEEFQKFKNLCELAYMTIRRHSHLIINLFTLMLSSDMPELQSIEDIMFLRRTLAIDETNERALEFFREQFDEAYNLSYTTKLDWMCHALNKNNLIQ